MATPCIHYLSCLLTVHGGTEEAHEIFWNSVQADGADFTFTKLVEPPSTFENATAQRAWRLKHWGTDTDALRSVVDRKTSVARFDTIDTPPEAWLRTAMKLFAYRGLTCDLVYVDEEVGREAGVLYVWADGDVGHANLDAAGLEPEEVVRRCFPDLYAEEQQWRAKNKRRRDSDATDEQQEAAKRARVDENAPPLDESSNAPFELTSDVAMIASDRPHPQSAEADVL